jgi:phospholipid-binding lipoprotein MlaA
MRCIASLVVVCLLISPIGAGAADEPRDPDPWEKFNRGIFWFNEKLDIYVLMYVAKGWRFIVPDLGRTAVQNFNDNLVMPVIFANDVLQLKPANSAYDVLRLAYNTTLGIGGLIDIATMIEIPKNDEDFGQTLGFWGVPSGPYLVLPIFGPSTIRGGVGRIGDAAGTYYFSLLPIYVTFIVRTVELVNLRSRYLEEVDENRRESFDYYVFMRDAYLQNRAAKIDRARGGESGSRDDDDLYYYFDDEDDFSFDDEPDEQENGPQIDGAEDRTKGAKDAN